MTAAHDGKASSTIQGADRGNAGAADAALQQKGNSAAQTGKAFARMQGIDRDNAGAADATIQQTGDMAAHSSEAVSRTHGADPGNAGAADAAIQQTGDTAAHSSEAIGRMQGIDRGNAGAPIIQKGQQGLRPGMLRGLLPSPGDALQLGITLAVLSAMFKGMVGALDPNKDAKRAGKRRADALSKRLGRRIHLQDLEHVRAAMGRPSGLPCNVS